LCLVDGPTRYYGSFSVLGRLKKPDLFTKSGRLEAHQMPEASHREGEGDAAEFDRGRWQRPPRRRLGPDPRRPNNELEDATLARDPAVEEVDGGARQGATIANIGEEG
jgi:hypothetical protein